MKLCTFVTLRNSIFFVLASTILAKVFGRFWQLVGEQLDLDSTKALVWLDSDLNNVR